MSETPMPKFIHFQSNISTIDTVVEYNGLYYKNGRLAFEPVPADAVLMTPSKETLAALLSHQPAILTKQQRWQRNLLDQLQYEPDLTYGQWLSAWERAVQAGRAREAAEDDYGLYETRKAHADAWREVEKQLGPHVAKERLNDLLGRLEFSPKAIFLAKKDFARSDNRNAYVTEALGKNRDHVGVFVDQGSLCIYVRPDENLDLDAELVLTTTKGDAESVELGSSSSLGMVKLPFHDLDQLVGAKLQVR